MWWDISTERKSRNRFEAGEASEPRYSRKTKLPDDHGEWCFCYVPWNGLK